MIFFDDRRDLRHFHFWNSLLSSTFLCLPPSIISFSMFKVPFLNMENDMMSNFNTYISRHVGKMPGSIDAYYVTAKVIFRLRRQSAVQCTRRSMYLRLLRLLSSTVNSVIIAFVASMETPRTLIDHRDIRIFRGPIAFSTNPFCLRISHICLTFFTDYHSCRLLFP